MSRSEHRGASWSGGGDEIIARAQDRRAAAAADEMGFTAAIAPGEDASTLAGAMALKRRILAYWAARGARVECSIERGLFGVWVVRSRLVNALPPGTRR